ncbi:DNA-primase RepB domain-containing protein [Bosea sp. (in: a-proteobacteria)]|uniref:DNA-primase RepB domain-containing protein n=1 Tax=Bosea sp. (in: a-proteobacteria) TaxID=1871050 RepID=UPI003F72FEC1
MPKRMNDDARPRVTGRAIRNSMAARYLNEIWSEHDSGFVFAAAMHRERAQWKEVPFSVSRSWIDLSEIFDKFPSEEYNLYFCPNAFSEMKRRREYALPSSLAWCDIDGADPDKFVPPPSVLVETSPCRFQGVWKFVGKMPVERCEAVSRGLAYRHNGDRNGWSVTKLLRVPWTINHKPQYRRPPVKLLRFDQSRIMNWPRVSPSHQSAVIAANAADSAVNKEIGRQLETPPKPLISKYRRHLPPMARSLIMNPLTFYSDRSKAIFIIIAGLYAIDVPRDEIAHILFHTVYFRSKHGTSVGALTKEVDRVLAKLEARNG